MIVDLYLPGSDRLGSPAPSTTTVFTKTAAAPAPTAPGKSRTNTKHPNLEFQIEGLLPIVVRLAPEESDEDGIGAKFTQVGRPDLPPLLLQGGRDLKTLALRVELGFGDRQISVEPERTVLRQAADLGNLVAIAGYGEPPLGVSWWRITRMSMHPKARQHGTNEVTRCDVDIMFTEASDASRNVGPITGGAAVSTYLARRQAALDLITVGKVASGVQAGFDKIAGFILPKEFIPVVPIHTTVPAGSEARVDAILKAQRQNRAEASRTGWQNEREIVVGGLMSIADAMAKNGVYGIDWKVVADYNNITTSGPLQPGTRLRIPPHYNVKP